MHTVSSLVPNALDAFQICTWNKVKFIYFYARPAPPSDRSSQHPPIAWGMRSWGVCVRAVCAIVGEHVEIRGWPCLSKLLSTIFSETWSLITEAGTCQFGWIGWAMRSMDPPASTFLELGLQAGKALPIFDMGDEDPNSGPHVYTENILPTEPPSQPPRLMLDPPCL